MYTCFYPPPCSNFYVSVSGSGTQPPIPSQISFPSIHISPIQLRKNAPSTVQVADSTIEIEAAAPLSGGVKWKSEKALTVDESFVSASGRSSTFRLGRAAFQQRRIQLKKEVEHLELQPHLQLNVQLYARLLRECGDLKALEEGKQVHGHLVSQGLELNPYLAGFLVKMYGKCGSPESAAMTFNKLPSKGVILWTALIGAYALNGFGEQALELFTQMQTEGLVPDKVTFNRVLSACSSLKEGKQIHACIMKAGLDANVIVGTALIEMYNRCKSVADARESFDRIDKKDVISCNAMIAAYIENGCKDEAFLLFESIDLLGLKPSKVTYVSILSACSSDAGLTKGKELHARIVRSRFDSDVIVSTSLVRMYGKCGDIKSAHLIFGKIVRRDTVCWNAMISTYAQNGYHEEALEVFSEMMKQGVSPDKMSYISALTACANLASLEWGRRLHESVLKAGLKLDITIQNCLINMYAKCGNLEEAKSTFKRMPRKDVTSWNVMLGAYVQHGLENLAIQLFQEMGDGGAAPDRCTFVSILDACANIADLEQGIAVHAAITSRPLDMDIMLGTALIDMYGKCGELKLARKIFDEMSDRNWVTWNALISAYSQHGQGDEALELFQEMQKGGCKPNVETFSSLLNACAILAALDKGKLIEAQIVESKLEADMVIESALIKMYGSCGRLIEACMHFDKMSVRDTVSWNEIIAAYALNGHGKGALMIFQQMQLEGFEPDKITFVNLLSSLSHAGMVEEGLHIFRSIEKLSNTNLTVELYGCLIDLLGRAGMLGEAEHEIKHMPFPPDDSVWTSFLAACSVHGDVDRGVHAANHLLRLNPQRASTYVTISNIYAAAGQWQNVAKVRKAMNDRELMKEPGQSRIEVNGRVHVFTSRDRSHPEFVALFVELDSLMTLIKDHGYVPVTNAALHDVAEGQKEELLKCHSEKLAIAYGLIKSTNGTPLHIVNNLRICRDCHAASKFISKVTGREISIRDAHRFHHFSNGVCSCGDYW